MAEGTSLNLEMVSGPPSAFTCPECGGTLWELQGGGVLRYRCHVGHGYTADSLFADQSDSLDNAFWGALRALEEHSMLRRRMAEHALANGRKAVARGFEREARQTELRASTIRQLLHAERPARIDGEQAIGDATTPARGTRKSRPGTRARRVNR